MLTILALFTALQIVVNRLLSIRLPFVTIGLGFVPNTLVAIMYGKYVSMAVSGISDMLGAILFPIGAFFPGYTLTALISGYIRGAGFYEKELSFKRIFATVMINQTLTSLLLNTFWIFITNDNQNFLPILLGRLLGITINTAIQIILTYYLLTKFSEFKGRLNVVK